MSQYNDIFVDRKGITNNAFMKTVKLIDVFNQPNQNLLFDGFNIKNTNCLSNRTDFNSYPDIAYVQIAGQFIKLKDNGDNKNLEVHPNNILGSSDLFIYNDNFEIPEVLTNQATLNFYGCKLIKSGDVFNLQNNKPMPLFEITVGPEYVQNYLLQENLGNGFYIESHNTPHFHQPLNSNSAGYIILAKRFENQLIMSKFKIPLGHGLYTPPYVYHSDAYLIGDYNVIYNKADDYKTFMFRNNNNNIIKVF
jgi:hypothetical protein